jgi:hypothetical protein
MNSSRWSILAIAALVLWPEPASAEEAATSGLEISGRVLERGTRRPLPSLPVLLPELATDTTTDDKGEFSLVVERAQVKGPVRLEIPALDHDALSVNVRPPAKNLVLRLNPRPQARYESVVEGPTADASRVRISADRAKEVAGSSGDPVKVVESLPGVARVGGQNSGQLVIRGSAPQDTRFYVDGLPVQQLYHFGGLYSVLQDTWFRDIDYRPGGFSAEYGDATGGLLGITLSALPKDGPHGSADVNVYHASAHATVPINNTWAVGAGVRRSYFDAFVPAIVGDSARFTAAPRYVDYQLRADGRPSPSTWLRILVYGSDDAIELLSKAPSDADPRSQGFGLTRSFHQIQAAADIALSARSSLYLGIGTSYQKLGLSPSSTTKFDLTFDPVTARSQLTWAALPQLTLRAGAWATVQRYRVDARLPLPTKEGQVAGPLSSRPVITSFEEGFQSDGAIHTDARYQPRPWLDAVGGVRVGVWDLAGGSVGVDPRLTVHWLPVERTTLTLSSGLYHQAPQPDARSSTFGNPNLGLERAVQTSFGVRQRLAEGFSAEITAFHKLLDNRVVAGPPGGLRYTNQGTGRIIGAEALIRVTASRGDGWLSYTLSKATRKDGPTATERLFSFDQTHVLALVGGYELGAGWKSGVRVRYATGSPYTPLTSSYYDAGADVFVPAPSAGLLSARVGDFFQMDVRIDKTWVYESWKLTTYLEASNLTNRANVEAIGYGYDYSTRRDIVGLPIIPSFGVRGTF